jgi:hypothetical protein
MRDARPAEDVYNRRHPGSSARARRKTMHYDAHQPVIDDLEARITTIRDSL